MANATGIRYPADRSTGDQDRALRELRPRESADPIGSPGALPDAERHATLIALATPELDCVYEKLAGSGYSLVLTDASGLVLYARSERSTQEPLNAVAGAPLTVTPEEAKEAHEPLTLEDLAGEDPQMLRNARSAYRIADSNVSVLIQGPTGSGKEAFAHAMHLASARASRPFVAVNCAAIPETLIESELFGYKAGAFTGARRDGMRGKILQSSGGTLFLDEIGDMPLHLQTRLLRVLEEQEVTPLGAETGVAVDLRVVCASNRDLRELVAGGEFRDDLYYRLNGIVLELPSLAARSDKELLILRCLAETGETARTIDATALRHLGEYSWPGNFRELYNVLRSASAICDGNVICSQDLPAHVTGAGAALRANAPDPAVSALANAECTALMTAIRANRGNLVHTAKQLGISRNALYRRLKRHRIVINRVDGLSVDNRAPQ